MLYSAVVVFCHASWLIQGQFVFRAQDHNMTNGDFAFFTFWPQRDTRTDLPWLYSVANGVVLPQHRFRAFHAVKQVREYYSANSGL